LDANGDARGTLYEDAGEGYGYVEGDYLLTTYVAERSGDELSVRVESAEGERARPDRSVNVVVLSDGGTFEGSGSAVDGITIDLSAGSGS
jgi:alpha-glucosidase